MKIKYKRRKTLYVPFIAEGVVFAADNGARVILLALGSQSPSMMLEEAIQYARETDCIVIAATGNQDADEVEYPAAYPAVIGVGATNSLDQKASFSNYGSGIDLVAPGDNIVSTWSGQSYKYMNGTSMASGLVAGLAGLLFSQDTSRSVEEVEALLFNSVDDLGAAGKDTVFGYGVIRADLALEGGLGGPMVVVQSTRIDDAAGDNDGTPEAGETVRLYPTISNVGGGDANNLSLTLRQGDIQLVTITDSSAVLSTLQQDSTKETSDYFEVELPSELPDSLLIELTVNIVDDTGEVWTGRIVLREGTYFPFALIPEYARASMDSALKLGDTLYFPQREFTSQRAKAMAWIQSGPSGGGFKLAGSTTDMSTDGAFVSGLLTFTISSLFSSSYYETIVPDSPVWGFWRKPEKAITVADYTKILRLHYAFVNCWGPYSESHSYRFINQGKIPGTINLDLENIAKSDGKSVCLEQQKRTIYLPRLHGGTEKNQYQRKAPFERVIQKDVPIKTQIILYPAEAPVTLDLEQSGGFVFTSDAEGKDTIADQTEITTLHQIPGTDRKQTDVFYTIATTTSQTAGDQYLKWEYVVPPEHKEWDWDMTDAHIHEEVTVIDVDIDVDLNGDGIYSEEEDEQEMSEAGKISLVSDRIIVGDAPYWIDPNDPPENVFKIRISQLPAGLEDKLVPLLNVKDISKLRIYDETGEQILGPEISNPSGFQAAGITEGFDMEMKNTFIIPWDKIIVGPLEYFVEGVQTGGTVITQLLDTKPGAANTAFSVAKIGVGDQVKSTVINVELGFKSPKMDEFRIVDPQISNKDARIGAVQADNLTFKAVLTPEVVLSDEKINWSGELTSTGQEINVIFNNLGDRNVFLNCLGKQRKATITVVDIPPPNQEDWKWQYLVKSAIIFELRTESINWIKANKDILFDGEIRDNSKANAAQHAYWNALVTDRYDETIANEAGIAHERTNIENGGAHNSSVMDLENNKVGRDLARDLPGSPRFLYKKVVLNALGFGDLTILDDIENKGERGLLHDSNK